VPRNTDWGEQLQDNLTRVFSADQPIPPEEYLLGHLTLNGDGSTFNMAVDGTTPKNFTYTVPDGKVCVVRRAIFICVDASMQYSNWFGFGSTLTNGCRLQFSHDGSTFFDFIDHPLQKTYDFIDLAGGDVNILQSGVGPEDDVMAIRWTLGRAGYVPLFREGAVLRMRIEDNLTAMTDFQIVIQGRVCDE
jgi:hypothetical protein